MHAAIVVLGLALANLQVCGSKDEGTGETKTTPTAEKATAGASAEAQIGGQMVAVGDNQVELKLYQSGFAEALVLDAKGAVIDNPAEAKLALHANAAAGAKQDIALDYQPPIARFAAKGDADAELAAGPVDVDLEARRRKKRAASSTARCCDRTGNRHAGRSRRPWRRGGRWCRRQRRSRRHTAAGAKVEGDADARSSTSS
jgi:hypothetical protein